MIEKLENILASVDDPLIKMKLRRVINRIKHAHFVPGKTKAPVPFVRNFDYIADSPYHGPMSRWKKITDYKKKGQPVEIWKGRKKRKSKGEKPKKKKRLKVKRMRPTRRQKRRAALILMLGKK
jgi:hypothetical protein